MQMKNIESVLSYKCTERFDKKQTNKLVDTYFVSVRNKT